jgi:hypothetical protein
MGNEIERRSWPVVGHEGTRTVPLIAGLRRRSTWWHRLPIELRAIVGGLVVGVMLGELAIRWGEHQNLSTYMAFVPAGIEIAGIPRSEMRSVGEHAVVRSFKALLDKYDAYCSRFPFEALKRQIDCEHVHRMDSEPVPND